MGIYWVYFKKEGNELKLQIEANDRVMAIAEAEKIADKMRCAIGWTYSHCDVCR